MYEREEPRYTIKQEVETLANGKYKWRVVVLDDDDDECYRRLKLAESKLRARFGPSEDDGTYHGP